MAKYLLHQPQDLETLAIQKFGAWMKLRAKHLMTTIWDIHQRDSLLADIALVHQIQTIRSYFACYMPIASILHETLVSEGIRVLSRLFMKTTNPQNNVILHMVETLLTKDLPSLRLTRQDLHNFGGSLVSRSHALTRLTRLTLALAPPAKGQLGTSATLETNITTFLQQLHSLKYFSCNSYCTDNILKCISKNCKLIEELDLNHSGTRINDDSIEILTQMPNLKIVHLCGTSVSRKGTETLLLSCKNIEQLDIGGGIFHILEHIAASEDYSGEQFMLKTCTTSATLKQLQLVIRMCPRIERMTVFKNQNLQSNIMALIDLENLRELELVEYNFREDCVEEMLQIKGRGLLHLHLKGVTRMDLIHVSQMCPHLESLSIEDCTFTSEKSEMTMTVPPFRHLKKLSVDKIIHQSFKHFVIFLMINCVNVEYIYMGRYVHLTEELLLQILDKNQLTCLKELQVWQCPKRPQALSTLVIDRIVRNCISYPQIIELPIMIH